MNDVEQLVVKPGATIIAYIEAGNMPPSRYQLFANELRLQLSSVFKNNEVLVLPSKVKLTVSIEE